MTASTRRAPAAATMGAPVEPPPDLVARAARARAELGALYPFEGRFVRGPRGWLHVVDEGPRDAPTVLLLHGNPSWSFLWRRVVPVLARRLRVLALDHLGCGLSGPLPRRDYGLAQRVEDAAVALAALDVHDAALVGHDWGGAIALGLARRRPERTPALALSNTAGFTTQELPRSIRLCRAPFLGPLLLEHANAFLQTAVRTCTASRLAPEVRRGYLLPHEGPGRRASIRAFVEDIPLSRRDRSWTELAEIERALPILDRRPALLLWGERDWCFHPGFRRGFEARLPNAQVVRLERSGHWWPEDQCEEGTAALATFLERALLP